MCLVSIHSYHIRHALYVWCREHNLIHTFLILWLGLHVRYLGPFNYELYRSERKDSKMEIEEKLMDEFHIIPGLPKFPQGANPLSLCYRPPKKNEWFLSRFSDDWILAENSNKRQNHLVLVTFDNLEDESAQ